VEAASQEAVREIALVALGKAKDLMIAKAPLRTMS
jgi:predicted dinucleotide-utilizing enzyme